MISDLPRPRIAIVASALTTGGGVPSVARFIHRVILRDGSFDVSLISLPMSSRDKSSVLIRDRRSWFRGVQVSRGHFNGAPYAEVGAVLGDIEFMRYRPRVALTTLLASCDLIQVIGGSAVWVGPVVGLGKPVALHAATLIEVERRKRLGHDRGMLRLWRRLMTKIAASFERAMLQKVNVVFVENPWVDAQVRLLAKQTPVRYGPPGVDIDLFRPARPGELAPIPEPYILCAGRLSDPRKNIGMLIKAYSRLPTPRPILILAGKSLPEALVAQQAERLGINSIRLIHAPSAAELAALYRHAICFALPSDEEGFGIVVVEAMASGIPVVATRCGGPEGIITEGEDGFLVNRDDVMLMSERLKYLCEQPSVARALGDRARRTVEAKYSDEAAGRAFLDTYKALLPCGRVVS